MNESAEAFLARTKADPGRHLVIMSEETPVVLYLALAALGYQVSVDKFAPKGNLWIVDKSFLEFRQAKPRDCGHGPDWRFKRKDGTVGCDLCPAEHGDGL